MKRNPIEGQIWVVSGHSETMGQQTGNLTLANILLDFENIMREQTSGRVCLDVERGENFMRRRA